MTTNEADIRGRRGQLEDVLGRLEDGGLTTEGDFSAVSMLVADAAVAGDDSALGAAEHMLKRVYTSQRIAASNSAGVAEERGRVLALIDLVTWLLRRLTPTSAIASIERNGKARAFMEAVAVRPGTSNRDLADVLGVDESAVSRIGRRLVDLGMCRNRKVGRTNFWEMTPRGSQALKQEPLISGQINRINRTRLRRRFAQYIVEVADVREREGATGRWLPVAGRVLATLLASPRSLTSVEIADRTRLSQSVVVASAAFLIEKGYVTGDSHSEPAGDSFLPDPAVPLSVNADSYCAIGIKILPNRLIGLVSDLNDLRTNEGQVLTRDLSDSREATVVAAIAELVRELRTPTDGAALPRYVIGIGIETGGHVDSRSGEVVYSPNLGWKRVDLAGQVRELTGLFTVVENDVNALAVHEQLVGTAADVENFAAILVSEGIGCGLILDGQLLHGVSGVAGEIGHIVVDPGGRECRCGRSGCLEAIASVPAILAQIEEASGENPGTIEAAATLAEDGDSAAFAVFERAGSATGQAISILQNLTNVGRILVAVPEVLDRESRTKASEVFATALARAVEIYAFSTAALDCTIDVRHLAREDERGAHGAASAVVREFVFRPLRWEPTQTVESVPEPLTTPAATTDEREDTEAESLDVGDLVSLLR